ncbi:putative acyl-coa dehydrogenase fade36 [Luminiphilus syltensis NOR5-1B]|uniref:Putative acyl-coa dehydrogenase fade36 n=2 Tax=Luminiphilus TaxID=1341118 RepID=B8KQG0_9GAMM|nr:putative acyl-coa dehydrogenase fade36 [Luminiphilus syltensis NOR5-1B]
MDTDAENILPWLRENLGWEAPQFTAALAGGNSNITWRFDSDDQACVVRTFPAETISPTAHRGIEREFKVLKAVEGRVRAPRVLGWGGAESGLGRPFLCLECIDGVAITDTLPDAYADLPGAADKLGMEMVDQLAAIHGIEATEPALEGLGRPENFLQRQLDRWLKVRRDTGVRELPALFELGDWLHSNIPPEAPASLIHGDYHLDNTLASRHKPEILAVIDWELSTVGDPYTDLGLALMLWGDSRAASPPAFEHLQSISRVPGTISRRDLAQRWSAKTGRSIDHLDYYMAFAFWRLAAIVEGAYCLYVDGKVDTEYARKLEYNVPALLKEAEQAAQGNW